jgi:hypothetical protein
MHSLIDVVGNSVMAACFIAIVFGVVRIRFGLTAKRRAAAAVRLAIGEAAAAALVADGDLAGLRDAILSHTEVLPVRDRAFLLAGLRQKWPVANRRFALGIVGMAAKAR